MNVSAAPSSESQPLRSKDEATAGIETEIRWRYSTIRTRVPEGIPTTVLHIGAEQTGVAAGSTLEPETTLTLGIGSQKTAREYFKHAPPTSHELENAILTIEDEMMRTRPMIARRSSLFTMDATIREIALIAGVSKDTELTLTLEAMEQTFDRLAAIALGRPVASEGIPASAEFAATLLILREFMHHMPFSSIIITGC